MSFTPIDITAAHRSAFKGHEVLGVLRAQLPYALVRGTVTYLVERPFDVIEEFVVRSIVELGDMSGPESIAQVLGFGQSTFVEPVTGRLERMGLVAFEEGALRASPALAESFKRRKWVETRDGKYEAARELGTGRWLKLGPPLRNAEQEEAVALAPHFAATGVEEFTSWLSGEGGPIAGASIHDVALDLNDRVGLVRDCDIVVYADEEDEMWWWEPFDPVTSRLAIEAREACVQLGADEAALNALRTQETELPPSSESSGGPTAARAETIVQKAEPSAGVKVKRYSTTKASGAIVDRISGASSEVIVCFPWIKRGALTSDIMGAFLKALSSGASVYVTYGIAGSPEKEDSHSEAIAKLASLKAPNTGERVNVVWTGSSHVKEVLVDRKHYLGGSFNRLSFRGDPDSETGQIRRESVIYTNAPDVIGHCRDEVTPLIQMELVRQASTAEATTTWTDWWKQWRPILRLSLQEEALSASIRSLPNDFNQKLDALRHALTLIHNSPDRDEAVAAIGVLNKMLPASFRNEVPPNNKKIKPFLKRFRKTGARWGVNVDPVLAIATPTT